MVDRLVTPPEGDVVSLALAKQHLLIDHAADDVLIAQVINAAVSYAEQVCNRGFLDQTWQALEPAFPAASCYRPGADVFLELRKGNLLEGSSVLVEYVDEAGTVRTLDASTYSIDSVSVPARLRLAPDQSWPSVQARWDAVRITYQVGWAEGAIPAPIVQAILLLIAQMFENRTPEASEAVTPIEFSFTQLLSTYRIHGV